MKPVTLLICKVASLLSRAQLDFGIGAGVSASVPACAPGVLCHVKHDGEPLVKGKHVTGFMNGEEEEPKLTHVVPSLVEDELLRLGAILEKMAS